MSLFRKELTDLLRPLLQPPGMTQKLVDALDDFLDRAGVPRDGAAPSALAAGGVAGAGVGAAPAAHFRKELTDLCRPQLKPPGFTQALVDTLDELLDRAGVPRDGVAAASSPSAPAGPAPAAPAPAAPVPAAPTGKLDGAMLRKLLGLLPDAPVRRGREEGSVRSPVQPPGGATHRGGFRRGCSQPRRLPEHDQGGAQGRSAARLVRR
jgi:hypothetical protein